jgi:ArsR family transcriptional regulator
MSPVNNERQKVRARVFKALSHPSRLVFIHRLADGECTVSELQRLVGSDMSTVSKHLSVLKETGLVKDDKRGNNVFYVLTCPCVLDFMHCIDNVLKTQQEEQGATLALLDD